MTPAPVPHSEIAVVGAGIAGLAAATALSAAGRDVIVIDKARGPGGRMSTRRSEAAAFDHGAQYFTARDPRFLAQLEAWNASGCIARWSPRRARAHAGRIELQAAPDDWWVPVPAMNALARHAARTLDLQLAREISAIERRGQGWQLRDSNGGIVSSASRVLVTAPAAQAGRLLGASRMLLDAAARVRHAPCWVAMAMLDPAVEPGWQALTADDPVLAWAAANGSKPGRGGVAAWVLHAQPDWSQAHLEDDAADVVARLLDAFSRIAGFPRERATGVAHRWRYARVVATSGDDCHYDAGLGLGLAGDGCRGARVEDAWLSGTALAARLLGSSPTD